MERETHEQGKPQRFASRANVEGGGYARNTEDNQDNITWKEGRGITINERFR